MQVLAFCSGRSVTPCAGTCPPFSQEGVRLLVQEGQHLLALGDDDLTGAVEQRVEVVGAVAFFAGVDRLTDGGAGLLEEGVGALAARSTLAVIVPVDLLRHGRPE